MKKIDNDQVDKKLKNLPITRIGNYIRSDIPILVQCLKCNHNWNTKLGNITHNNNGCPKCAGNIKLTNKDVDIRIQGRNIKRLEDIKSVNTPIRFQCLIDGYIWSSQPNHIFNGHGCPKCVRLNPITQDEFDNMLALSQYKRIGPFILGSPISIQCLKCNYIFKHKNIRRNKKKCLNCLGIKKLTNDDVDKKLSVRNIKRLEDYKGNKKHILFECLVCNNTWNAAPSQIFKGSSCPYCFGKYQNETKIGLLIKKYIKYDEFYKNKKVEYNNRTYIPDYVIRKNNLSIFIERNGEQHYRPITFGGSIDKAKEKFIKTQLRDEQLRKFCLEHKVILLEIPYWWTEDKIIVKLKEINNIQGSKMKYPLATNSWGQEEIDAAKKVLYSGKCTMGDLVKDFEQQFSNYFGAKYAIMCNSGSSANLLCLSSLLYRKNGPRLTKGDEILVPGLSWPTTFYPISQIGCSMRFIDIDLNTLNIDISKIENAITEKTKAIFAVNILGNPCDFSKLIDLCNKYNLILLEDNCESMSAQYNNKYCGTFGLMGTYSGYFSHHINTIESGIITTDDEELYQILYSLRSHGWTRGLPDINHICNKTGDPFIDSYNFILPGYNFRPTELNAAIGIEQIKKLNNFIKIRRNNLDIFITQLNERNLTPYIIPQTILPNAISSSFGFPIILNDKLRNNRTIVSNKLIEMGIECRPIVAGNFTRNSVIQYLNYSISNSLEMTDRADKDGLFIGNNPQNLTTEITYFFDTVESILKTI